MNRLVSELAALPGIGEKSAGRLADHLIRMPKEKVRSLTEAITDARENVHFCRECFTLTDSDMCPVCSDENRDHSVIMVVEDTRDMQAYEKTGRYTGVYHVLQGAMSPMLGIGPNDIRIKELLARLDANGDGISEVIIAMNSSVEGEATAMYLSKLIKPLGIKVTRIASGVPVGGYLENTDEITLLRALDGRFEL